MRRIALLAATAVLASAGAASAWTASVPNPVTGCTTYVYGPDITMSSVGPKPGVTMSGGHGARVDCP